MVVSFVGRLTAIKRPDRFCDVVRRVAATTSAKVVFLVAGMGQEAAYVRQRAADEQLPIQMLGWVERVAPVFAASDLTLLTSDNEGTPISLVQAGMAGCRLLPPTSARCARSSPTASPGWCARPMPTPWPRATASLIADPVARRKLGDAAIEHTRRFTTDALAAAHLELYRQLLEGAGAAAKPAALGPRRGAQPLDVGVHHDPGELGVWTLASQPRTPWPAWGSPMRSSTSVGRR